MDVQVLSIGLIIERAGGAQAVVDCVNADRIEAEKKPLTVWAVYKWPTIGVPDQYWPVLIEMAGVTSEQIYQANRLARAAA